MRLPQHFWGRDPSASAGAPQVTARSPSAAHVGGGGMFSFAVHVTWTLPGVQTNPSQHPALLRVEAPHS